MFMVENSIFRREVFAMIFRQGARWYEVQKYKYEKTFSASKSRFSLYFSEENRITFRLCKIYEFPRIQIYLTSILLCFGCTERDVAKNSMQTLNSKVCKFQVN